MIFQRVMHLAKRQPLVVSLTLFGITTLCGPASAWNSASNLHGFCATLVDELDRGIAPLSYVPLCALPIFKAWATP